MQLVAVAKRLNSGYVSGKSYSFVSKYIASASYGRKNFINDIPLSHRADPYMFAEWMNQGQHGNLQICIFMNV